MKLHDFRRSLLVFSTIVLATPFMGSLHAEDGFLKDSTVNSQDMSTMLDAGGQNAGWRVVNSEGKPSGDGSRVEAADIQGLRGNGRGVRFKIAPGEEKIRVVVHLPIEAQASEWYLTTFLLRAGGDLKPTEMFAVFMGSQGEAVRGHFPPTGDSYELRVLTSRMNDIPVDSLVLQFLYDEAAEGTGTLDLVDVQVREVDMAAMKKAADKSGPSVDFAPGRFGRGELVDSAGTATGNASLLPSDGKLPFLILPFGEDNFPSIGLVEVDWGGFRSSTENAGESDISIRALSDSGVSELRFQPAQSQEEMQKVEIPVFQYFQQPINLIFGTSQTGEAVVGGVRFLPAQSLSRQDIITEMFRSVDDLDIYLP